MATAEETPNGIVQRWNTRIPWNIEPHLREEKVGTEVADGIYLLKWNCYSPASNESGPK